MALTEEEKLELASLEKKYSGLSPEEEKELALLEEKYSTTPEKEDVSKLESAGRGFGQGATLGFQDELSAGLSKSLLEGDAFLRSLLGKGEIDVPTYKELREELRQENLQAQEANPGSYLGGELAGALTSTFVPGGSALNVGKGAKLGTTIGKGALEGSISGLGYSESDDVLGTAKDVVLGAGLGGAFTTAGKYAGDAMDYAGRKTKDLAEGLYGSAKKMALNATGATGNQVSKFSDDAGEEILKRTRAFDTPESLSKRLGEEVSGVNQQLDTVLSKLDDEGVVINKQTILDKLQKEIDDLGQYASKADEKEKLLKIYQNIQDTSGDEIAATFAEREKRGFQSKARRMYGDPDKGDALKATGRIYKESVEDATAGLSDELGGLFKEQKKKYALLNPIKEASDRRALQQQQSPYGGLLDVAALGAGAYALGPGDDAGIGALAFPFLRRKLAPRLPSTSAVITNKISGVVSKGGDLFPKLGGFLSRGADVGARVSPMYKLYSQELSETNNPAASYYGYAQRVPDESEE